MEGEAALTAPQTFAFKTGVKPYDIQRRLMHDLFGVLEGGGLGIFESPTGTVGVVP